MIYQQNIFCYNLVISPLKENKKQKPNKKPPGYPIELLLFLDSGGKVVERKLDIRVKLGKVMFLGWRKRKEK